MKGKNSKDEFNSRLHKLKIINEYFEVLNMLLIELNVLITRKEKKVLLGLRKKLELEVKGIFK